MKKLYLFLAFSFSLVAGAAFGQGTKWDSAYRPNLYAWRVDLFKSFPNASSDIIFLGNSLTERAEWNELLGMKNVRNRGISGDITFGVLERIGEVVEGKPAKVFILIGINDISRNIPDTQIVANYHRMIAAIRKGSPKTKIYFHTLLPVNNEFTQFKNHYNKDEHILWVNEQIRKLGKDEGVTVIDLYPHFLSSDKKLEKKYTEDGLHLNAEGYKVWAQILKNGNYLK